MFILYIRYILYLEILFFIKYNNRNAIGSFVLWTILKYFWIVIFVTVSSAWILLRFLSNKSLLNFVSHEIFRSTNHSNNKTVERVRSTDTKSELSRHIYLAHLFHSRRRCYRVCDSVKCGCMWTSYRVLCVCKSKMFIKIYFIASLLNFKTISWMFWIFTWFIFL